MNSPVCSDLGVMLQALEYCSEWTFFGGDSHWPLNCGDEGSVLACLANVGKDGILDPCPWPVYCYQSSARPQAFVSLNTLAG